jgi:hypothetical protein
LRWLFLRLCYVQWINFLPSAYILVQTIVVLIVALPVFTKIEPVFDSIVILVFLTYLFVYILKLLQTLDRPFREDEKTMDDVSLFLLHELEAELKAMLAGS